MRSSSWRKREPASRRVGDDAHSRRPDVKPIYLLAALGVATVAAFILSLSIGPAGLGIDATGRPAR